MPFKLYMIRPPREDKGFHEYRELFRYANGEWIEDDGQSDLAFGGITKTGWPYAYGFDFGRREPSHEHPNEIAFDGAMSFVCDRYHCANGRRVK